MPSRRLTRPAFKEGRDPKSPRNRPRLSDWPLWTLFARSALVCSILGALLFGLALKRIEHYSLSSKPLQFDARQAHSNMVQLAKGFPGRVTWAEPRKKAALWLRERLNGLGYQAQGMQFSETIAGRQYLDLENIYAEKRGTKHPDEIVVVTAHYDITDTTDEGAMDDASGVGTVLELARVFAKQESERTLIFLLTDSEEFGAFWGARSFVSTFDRTDKIIAAVSFDFISPGKQTQVLTLCDGLKQGYTPLWLRELALDSVRSLGTVVADDMTGVLEFIQRAIQIPAADHGPFLAAGVPAFNWVGQPEHFAFVMAHFHHTKFDVAEAIEPQSFEAPGKAAERLIYSLNALSRVPANFRDSSYWKISRGFYIEGWAVTLLHVLAFIPFLIYSVVKFRAAFDGRTRPKAMTVLQNEAKNMATLLASFLLGYVVILLLPELRIITQYEAFPATQKSLLLYTPNFLAILLVVGAVGLVYWMLKKLFSDPDDTIGYAEIRQAFHAGFLTIIVFLALIKNSYLGTLLLLPPAYLWMAIRTRGSREDRVMNMFLLLGGAITFVTVGVVMATVFHVGVFYWYLFLSAAYGLISAYSVVLFFMALTVMIRLFRAFVL